MTSTARESPSPERAAPRVQPARRVAYEVMRAVREDDAYANLLLPSLLAEARLAPADAALATELAYGTLRRRGYYDRVLSLVIDRPLEKLDPEVLDALRLGVHQLLSMRVAAHAAVGESVALVASAGKGSAKGFANGVLRTITRSTPGEWRERALDGLRGDARLAVEYAHPDWVVARLPCVARRRRAGPTSSSSCWRPTTRRREVSLVALPGLATVDDVGEPGGVSPIGARSAGGDPSGNAVVASGRARVQDEGSQLAALALSRARPDRRGRALARPVRGTGRQGRGARGGGRARGCDPRRERARSDAGAARAQCRWRCSIPLPK